MFTTFSSVLFSPPPANVIQEVQDILDAHGITFGTLITNVLQDTTVPLGATVISDLENILEGLCPHLDEDKKVRILLEQFFASIVSPEFLQFEKCDGEMLWKLPPLMLSTEQLMGFSLEEMGKRFASDAPGLSSSLGGICRGKLGDCKMNSKNGEDNEEGDIEDDPELGMEARWKVSPAQRLEIIPLGDHQQ